jgi:hypothetical protein
MTMISEYRRFLLPQQFDLNGLIHVAADYRAIIWNSMKYIVERNTLNTDYGWIDTKFNLITGRDFSDDDPLRGRGVVYSWIQGRALEALTQFALWLKDNQYDNNHKQIINTIDALLLRVLTLLEKAREKNGDHLFFSMTPDGTPFLRDDKGTPRPCSLTGKSPYNNSDRFCSKGMYVAAWYLGDAITLEKARKYCLETLEASWRGDFQNDQQPMDPKNKCIAVAGRREHLMLDFGATCLLTECEEHPLAAEFGLRILRHTLDKHVNLNNRWPHLKAYDFVEFVNDSDEPYEENGVILSDPGHALEFVGLGLKFIQSVLRHNLGTAVQKKELRDIAPVLCDILDRNYSNGFHEIHGGICKGFDLAKRRICNGDMPWWSLPETIRASCYCLEIAATQKQRLRCLEILRNCHNAFAAGYVRPDLHCLSVQTRDSCGAVADVIPAISDVDPGYHTAICLMDALSILSKTGSFGV